MTKRRGTGRRVPATASYATKAECHSEPSETGCWLWRGSLHSGLPYVHGRPDDPRRGLVNLRVALLVERGVERPERAGPARPVCGTADCVRPDHLDWTPADEVALARRALSSPSLSLDEVREAARRRAAGEPVTQIARSLGISRQGLYRQWAKWDTPGSAE